MDWSNIDLKQEVTVDQVNEAFRQAAEGPLKGIMAYTTGPLVSVDFNTTTYSAIIDALSTMVMQGRKVKVMAWYDNEWGYASRVTGLAMLVACQL